MTPVAGVPLFKAPSVMVRVLPSALSETEDAQRLPVPLKVRFPPLLVV